MPSPRRQNGLATRGRFARCLIAIFSILTLPSATSAKPLDSCERACGHAIAECLLESVSGRASARAYRQCRRAFLPLCRAGDTEVCFPPPSTTTTTLAAVPNVSLSGRWILELELLEVFRCKTPSTVDSLVLEIEQDGTALTATVHGNGTSTPGYAGQVSNAGFTLAFSYQRRIRGRRCRGEVSLVASGFDPIEIPVVVSASGQCGRSLCGATQIGTLRLEEFEEE